ncbi:excalibur calcium-binding domain-containing protein [Nocardia pneumoniae]|uniref:excalibur calcium-binding domain-containing protein n=1 Tax=Nocardia pneumoniae TaxID=228601 RepID=UPI00030CF607
MKTTLLRTLPGLASACLLATTLLAAGSSVAAADPLGELLCGTGSAQFCAPTAPPPVNPPQANNPRQPGNQPQAPYYKNCTEVRNAGKAPLLRGQPGYAPHLDRDNDGIACE